MPTKPLLLDLFCGAGGMARGYQQAGFYVVGVDHKPQPRYAGDEFIQEDAMTFPLDGFDVVHASPPCQRFSVATVGRRLVGRDYYAEHHPDLLTPTHARLKAWGGLWVIENVVGAPRLSYYITLCGLSFGLKVFRHRMFQSSCFLLAPPHESHAGRRIGEGMTRKELTQAIPPAYAEFVGRQLRVLMEKPHES